MDVTTGMSGNDRTVVIVDDLEQAHHLSAGDAYALATELTARADEIAGVH